MRPGGTAKDLQETLARLLADAAVAEYAEQYDQLSLPPCMTGYLSGIRILKGAGCGKYKPGAGPG